jgi:DNA-binding NarL/FixJ family response regulator
MTRRRDIRAMGAIDIVEEAYRLDGSEAEWLDRLLATARPDLDTGCGVYAFTGNEDVPNLPASPVFVQQDLDPGFGARLMELNREAPKAIYDLIRMRLVTCGGLEATLGADSPVVAHFRTLMQPTGVKDGFSLFAQDAQGGSVTLSAPSRSVVEPAPRVRGIWRRVGLHAASALRLRRKLAAQEAVRDALLDPSGKLHDATGAVGDDRTARGVLVRAVQAMEEARSAEVRGSPERALSLWQGLVGGEWSLVEHWESGGRRYLAAYRNRPEIRDPRALTPSERSMVKYLALGATNKDIMYALGLPAGTVSASVTQILRKLRVKRRVDLAVVADPTRMSHLDVPLDGGELGVLAVDARPRGEAAAALSPAELEVAALVVRGLSNDEIASERQVSLRTIANQLRSIYDKLHITSRSQLARAMTSTISGS